MARMIVTGASGFIGSRLVDRLLTDGNDVTVMLHAREPVGESFTELEVLRADVTQPSTLRGKFDRCDAVMHLAGTTIARSAREFLGVNRDGTENIARACAAATTPPKLLFVSSLAAAGPASQGQPLAEGAPPAPISDYGRSKWEAEKILLHLSDRLPIQIVRPPSVMGDSDPHMLGLFKAAKAGWVFLPGSTPYRYSMIHVDDLVDAIIHVSRCNEVRLMPDPKHSPSGQPKNPSEKGSDPLRRGQKQMEIDSPPKVQTLEAGIPRANPGLVHLAQNPPLTFVQTAQLIHDVFRRGEVRTVGVPKSLCWLVAASNSIAAGLFRSRALLNLDKMREGMAGEWMADSTRLTRGLGFAFPMSLEERIRQTAESYHEKGWM